MLSCLIASGSSHATAAPLTLSRWRTIALCGGTWRPPGLLWDCSREVQAVRQQEPAAACGLGLVEQPFRRLSLGLLA